MAGTSSLALLLNILEVVLSVLLQQTFWNFDRDRSGTVEPNELQQALNAFGYRLSPQAFQILVARYGVNGKIGFDDFISCCIKLRILTGELGRGGLCCMWCCVAIPRSTSEATSDNLDPSPGLCTYPAGIHVDLHCFANFS